MLERLEVEADVVTIEGDPAGAVIEVADDRRADLVVVGSPEAGFLDRIAGLDVGGAVERRAHCDVLVVR
jgi:nucleotide-binding universal stress UspA family protein